MLVRCILLPLLITLTGAAAAQTTRLQNPTSAPSLVQQHLQAVNHLAADTTYRHSAIPSNSMVTQARSDAALHFPYPIIFIHGLVSSADTWLAFYNYALEQGWSYGGQLRFNLNADKDFSYSNISSPELSDVVDFNESLEAADFYLINFNCAVDGTPYGQGYNTRTQSNQAAIVKQGLAIGQAVQHVLTATGRQKVILFGHSMGGLAAREYLQNSDLWPPDGDHHIAKLVTTGTPHGGSNSSGAVFSQIVGLDEGSDAVRDLRRSYFYSAARGVYLYGGREHPGTMNDRLFGFQDYDVNCNGQEGDLITGLNEKDIFIDLDFACIIGNANPLGGDYVVGLEEAQIKTYYDILSETFTIGTGHTALPDQVKTNFYGLDEPDFYDLSYEVETDKYYHGFITAQAPDALYPAVDFDDYVFITEAAGQISIQVENIATAPFGISILDANYDYLFDQQYTGDPIETANIQLPAGTYYLEFSGTPDTDSWQYPYFFQVNWTRSQTTPAIEAANKWEIQLSPNPVAEFAHLQIDSETRFVGVLQLHNELGQLLWQKDISGLQIIERIDMLAMSSGLYFLTITSPEETRTIPMVKKGE